MREDYYAINPGLPIQEDIIADVVHYVAKDDGRIQASELTLDKWARAVTGIGADLLKDIVTAYYAKHDPKNPEHKPIQPGWIRAEATSRMERAQNLKRLEAPRETPPKGRLNMTRRTLSMWQSRGYMLDQNPEDYPER